nr:hypothetical protein [Tanacetum cinerariifolium]
MDNKKHIVNLESFKEMLHICPRLPHQPFVEPSFKEEIMAFLRFLRHSGEIRRLTDVNINKLHQPWRSFAAIINKCLTKKSSGYDSLRNSNAYKEYYAVATGATPPKPKASVQKTRSSSDTTVTPPTAAACPRLTTSEKGKQAAKASKAKSLSALSKVVMTEAQQLKLATKRSLQQTYISQVSGSGADKGTGSIPGVPDVPTDESEEEISWNSTDEEVDDDEGKDGDGDDEGNVGDDGEEGDDDDKQNDDEAHDDDDQEDVENDEDDEKEGNGEENLGTNVGREEGHDEEEEEDELYRDVNINLGRGIQLGDVHTTQKVKDSHMTLTPINPDGQQQSSFRMNEAVKVAVQIQSDCLCDEAQAENDEFLKTINENMQKIIKEQVKEQVKVQVSKILPKIEQTVNEQLKAEVLTRNLYKALVEAYEFDKIILDTYRETVTLKRRRNDDADKDEEPSVGSDWGSKRHREGKEPESASAPKEKATRSAGKSTQGSKS